MKQPEPRHTRAGEEKLRPHPVPPWQQNPYVVPPDQARTRIIAREQVQAVRQRRADAPRPTQYVPPNAAQQAPRHLPAMENPSSEHYRKEDRMIAGLLILPWLIALVLVVLYILIF